MIEPFSAEPEAGCYVPRTASELAIQDLQRALAGRQTRIVLLYGPPGIGKSVLLQQVEHRFQPPHVCLRMEHESLSAEAICAWLGRELESRATHSGQAETLSQKFRGLLQAASPQSRSPTEGLLRQVEGYAQRGLHVVAMVDSADDIDAESIRYLAQVSKRAAGAFRICVASSNPSLATQVTDCAQVVHYVDPLSETETRDYICARLERAQAVPGFLGRLDSASLRRLFRFSGGNPRRLHAELSLIRIELQAQEREQPRGRGESLPRAKAVTPVSSPPVAPPRLTRQPAAWSSQPASVEARAGSSRSSPGARLPVSREPSSEPAEPQEPLPPSTPRPPEAAQPPSPEPLSPEPLSLEPESLEPASLAPGPDLRSQETSSPTDASPAPSVPLTSEPPTPSPATPTAPRGIRYVTAAAAILVLALAGWLVRDAPTGDTPTGAAPTEASSAPPRPPLQQEVPSPPPVATAPAPVAVNINAEPWAEIEIDGRRVGDTPLGDVPVEPGLHVFRASFSDGRVVERRIVIDAESRWVYFD